MADKKGDQQSRIELLGKLLIAAGEKPYMLSHGTDKETYYVILLKMNDKEIGEFESSSGTKPTAIKMAGFSFVPLQLESDLKAGEISSKLYNPENSQWTATTAIRCYKPQ